ncbi:uncharacterized protein LOC135714404 [Ochlerotatus camptorhynchus]|uniref:uncharacterized protein LOC135714404 n=1 Tax=Ochlerotatus camptorhynchus TaxID=644619 RepID=UPI0031E00875
MEVKRVRVTNCKQFNLLVSRMEANSAVAKGMKYSEAFHISKERYADIWNELCSGLNSLGPPTRSVQGWQKVWTDFKLKVKNKLKHNKREASATGGGSNQMVNLSPNEETIVNLLSLDQMVNHSGSVFGLPQCESSPRETTLEHEYEADDEVGTENVENIGNNSHTNEVGNSSSYNRSVTTT